MMLYTVKYRTPGAFMWRTIRHVKGDALVPNTQILQIIRNDESLTEINMADHEIQFSKERFYSIQERMSREAGQAVLTNRG